MTETDERARAEQMERAFAARLSWGLPAGSVLAAVGVGIGFGVGPAILVLAAGALVAVIALLWSSVRTLGGDAPLGEGLAAAAAMRGGVSNVADRKRRVLRALKDLDLEHSIGKIDDADYAEISARYREQAKEILREMDVEIEPLRAKAETVARRHLEKKGIALPGGESAKKVTVSTEPDEAVLPERGTAPAKRVACAGCRTSNEPDATFCKKCGAALAKTEVPREPEISEAKDA
jgi:hypothetical protein